MERKTNPTPDLKAVLRAQMILLAEPPRGKSLFFYLLILDQGALTAATGSLIGIQVTLDDNEAAIYDMPKVTEFGLEPGTGAIFLTFLLMLVWALSWRRRVWRSAEASRAEYFHSLPVGRQAHTLARVAVGALWLVALCGGILITIVATAFLFRNGGPFPSLPMSVWLSFFLSPLLVYLPLRRLSPRYWIAWGAVLVLFFWSMMSLAGANNPATMLVHALAFGDYGLLTALVDPMSRALMKAPSANPTWLPALLIWLTLASAAVTWTSSWRRDSN